MTRISILKEDRIWDLVCQGYRRVDVAKIVNCGPSSTTTVIRRVRNRPSIEKDPIRRGRRRAWLSDAQLDDIRTRRAQGEKLASIGKDYWLDPRTICSICKHRSYTTSEETFPWDFSNRLRS